MDLSTLRGLIIQHFNDSELRDLCFDLRVDYDNLGGSGKNDKMRELITFMERRGRLPELINECRRQRPHVAWPNSAQSTPPAQPQPPANPQFQASSAEERGLAELARRLAHAGTETLAELATLEYRLRDNRRSERAFGSNETNRSDRAQIISALNEFALHHCGVSFNELCRI